jgi:hypothetical protein
MYSRGNSPKYAYKSPVKQQGHVNARSVQRWCGRRSSPGLTRHGTEASGQRVVVTRKSGTQNRLQATYSGPVLPTGIPYKIDRYFLVRCYDCIFRTPCSFSSSGGYASIYPMLYRISICKRILL